MRRTVLAILLVLPLAAGSAPTATALSHNRDGVALSALRISGGEGTASTRYTVRTNRRVAFQSITLAVRDAKGRSYNFGLHRSVAVRGKRSFEGRRSGLAPGRYTAWVAYRLNGSSWRRLGAIRSFTVAAPAPRRPAPTVAPPAPGAWSLAFADEFSGTTWDTTKWTYRSSSQADSMQGNPGNQQLEWNQGSNCTVEGGMLVQTAKRETYVSKNGNTYNWTSCLLTSSPSYSFTYGYIEERAKFPAQAGFWPAFWTWQIPGGTQTMETDTYEYYSDNRTKLYLTSHVGLKGGCTITLAFDPSTDFHSYGVDIRPDGTTWYVDGQRVCDAPGAPTAAQNLITNMAVYATKPPRESTTHASKHVDYIRAWHRQ